jgi:tRNA (cmo5U34)-methyltransferase
MTTNTDPLRDDVVADGPWTFDAEVAAKFDDMLARSIPGLALLRELVPEVADASLASSRKGRGLAGSYVLDVGTSRGSALDPFVEAGAHCLGLEISEPMYEIARDRFAGKPNADVWNVDAREFVRRQAKDRESFPLRYDVVLCVLTLQFMPIEHRPEFLANLARITNPGGVLILVEKIQQTSPWADRSTVAAYRGHKIRNGYSEEQIDSKAVSLEGVLVPLPSETNRRLVLDAGWSEPTTFWQALAFEAFVARKEGW